MHTTNPQGGARAHCAFAQHIHLLSTAVTCRPLPLRSAVQANRLPAHQKAFGFSLEEALLCPIRVAQELQSVRRKLPCFFYALERLQSYFLFLPPSPSSSFTLLCSPSFCVCHLVLSALSSHCRIPIRRKNPHIPIDAVWSRFASLVERFPTSQRCSTLPTPHGERLLWTTPNPSTVYSIQYPWSTFTMINNGTKTEDPLLQQLHRFRHAPVVA